MHRLMKLKAFLAVAILGTVCVYAVNPPAASVGVTPALNSPAAYTHGQCHATAKSTGQRCKRGVSNAGDRFCYQHK
jgi:hypothetical protein